jgi:hypothetical protein
MIYESLLKNIDHSIIGLYSQENIKLQYKEYTNDIVGNLYVNNNYVEKKIFENLPEVIDKKEYDTTNNISTAIVITAWKSENFIKDTLDSINNNSKLPDLVIIGIDGCEETKNKLLFIVKNYNFKFKYAIYFSKENVGTFTIRNHLINIVFNKYKCNTIIHIDSDDLIHPEYIYAFQKCAIDNPNCIICPEFFINFTDKTLEKHSIENYEVGDNGYSKDIWDIVGYYLPIRGYADREWFCRAYKLGITAIKNKSMVYYRRIHANQITANKSYYKNEQRAECRNLSYSNMIIHPKIKDIKLDIIYETFV